MLKVGDLAVYIGQTEPGVIEHGDVVRIRFLFHEGCDQMADIGIKLPPGFSRCICTHCNTDVSNHGNTLPCYSKYLRKPSDEELLQYEIAEALKAPVPVKKFLVYTEEQLHQITQYGKTYLKQKFIIKFTDNFNFDE